MCVRERESERECVCVCVWVCVCVCERERERESVCVCVCRCLCVCVCRCVCRCVEVCVLVYQCVSAQMSMKGSGQSARCPWQEHSFLQFTDVKTINKGKFFSSTRAREFVHTRLNSLRKLSLLCSYGNAPPLCYVSPSLSSRAHLSPSKAPCVSRTPSHPPIFPPLIRLSRTPLNPVYQHTYRGQYLISLCMHTPDFLTKTPCMQTREI